VTQVKVSQNQQVAAGMPLFEIDPEPYRIARDGAQAQLGITHDQIAAESRPTNRFSSRSRRHRQV
jgi:multidrug resistance efflux pump